MIDQPNKILFFNELYIDLGHADRIAQNILENDTFRQEKATR